MGTSRLIPAMLITVGCMCVVVLLPGCAAYQLGNSSLYNPNIRTIYIPVVRNDTFRPMVCN
jgi:hypothetical protein